MGGKVGGKWWWGGGNRFSGMGKVLPWG